MPDYADKPEIVDMYEYYAGMQEPWDGPALLIFCDGKQLGASSRRAPALAGTLQFAG